MDDTPNERFDMNNDYEGGQWIDGEYFYTNKRQKTMQTREDQLYGIWGDSDSDDERRGKRGPREKADLTRPVGFVSSGVAKPTEDADKQARQSQSQRQEQTGSGLGFASAGPAQEDQEAELDSNLFPTAFGQRSASAFSVHGLKAAPGQLQEQLSCVPTCNAASQSHALEAFTLPIGPAC